MTFRADILASNKTVYLYSDTVDAQATYKVLELYVDGSLYKTHVEGGSATIDGVDYVTSTDAQDLLFSSVVTSNGTEYVFEINSYVIGVTPIGADLSVLPQGVWTLKLIHMTPSEDDVLLGLVAGKDVYCCISEKMSSIYCGNSDCEASDVLASATKAYMSIKSAEVSASLGELEAASCSYKGAEAQCGDGCECGCS